MNISVSITYGQPAAEPVDLIGNILTPLHVYHVHTLADLAPQE
jgi:hypothetical protein